MIIVRLWGGLGNQMFEYATGRRLAVQNKTTLKLDIRWFTLNQSPDAPALRHYELDCFTLKPHFATRLDMARIDTPPHTPKRKLYRKITKPIRLYRESETADFYPEVLDAPDNSYLEGFWQSEDYFKDIEKLIRDDFKFKKLPQGRNLELANLIKKVDAVSLHVRRGDMAAHPEINALHGLAPLGYYKNAIELIIKRVKNPHFFIFSDEPEWCKTNLKLKYPATYVDHNADGSEDMRLMSLCRHHIIANSSFSWWGAWLNPNPDKIVMAPKRWFNDPKMSTERRLPESWIKL